MFLLSSSSSTLGWSPQGGKQQQQQQQHLCRALLVLLLTTGRSWAENRNWDQFTYGDTDISNPNNYIFGPNDWNAVMCLNLTTCLGWPENWIEGIGWGLTENDCIWCPADATNDTTGLDSQCQIHHSSPINVERSVADNTTQSYNECLDDHLMRFYDSSCTFAQLVQYNAFTVERHALKIAQPLMALGNDQYRVACSVPGVSGPRWGRMDFSGGYPEWWWLSHVDIHVPSEHTQHGRRYDAEIQMHHFYSEQSPNQLSTASVFLQAYENTPEQDELNRAICQWRRYEEQTRQQCALPSVTQEYPGCYTFHRGNTTASSRSATYNQGKRRRRTTQRIEHEPNEDIDDKTMFRTAHDLLMHNYRLQQQQAGGANSSASSSSSNLRAKKLLVDDPQDMDPADDVDWADFVASVYEQDRLRQQKREEQAAGSNSSSASRNRRRRLMNYDFVLWNNYFAMAGVRTEYYMRYFGTQTIPPCYSTFHPNSGRAYTNHWRLMKDPMRVSYRQIRELNRLLRDRIAPITDPVRPCQPDTAATMIDDQHVSVARPLQSTTANHMPQFCECNNWRSQWQEDKDWCKHHDLNERLYTVPYNYETNNQY